MTTPELQLRTLYVLDDAGRLVRTREPGGRRPPLFALVRGTGSCAWAIRADVGADETAQLSRLLSGEPPSADLEAQPRHAGAYRSMGRVESGPAFAFPPAIDLPDGVVLLEGTVDAGTAHFPWLRPELAGRSPAAVVTQRGQVVSVCCCARRSDEAAEASLETAVGFRGQGLAPKVTAAWALAVRETGRVPLYSTAWTNDPSRRVAAKLGLIAYASDWSVYDA